MQLTSGGSGPCLDDRSASCGSLAGISSVSGSCGARGAQQPSDHPESVARLLRELCNRMAALEDKVDRLRFAGRGLHFPISF